MRGPAQNPVRQLDEHADRRYEQKHQDRSEITYAATSLVLLGVVTLACLAPARRATRVDPATALRE